MNKKSQSPNPIKKKSNQLSFPDAIKLLISGRRIRRIEWSDNQEYCLLKESFLMIHRNGKFHTWIVSEGDLMAIDWVTL